MGDILKNSAAGKVKRTSLEEKIEKRRSNAGPSIQDNDTIDRLAKNTTAKDKPISLRVNSATYIKFKQICEARGIRPNACIGMLMSDFVLENKHLIEED